MGKAPVPEVDYAKEKEKKDVAKLDRETQIALIQTQTTKPEVRDLILKIAKVYDLPPLGITILGGKPYVNVTGLDDKIKKRWLNDGWVKSEVTTEIQRATRENKFLAGYTTEIEMVNFKLFRELLQAIASNSQTAITPELVESVKKSCTVPFKFDGWTTPDTCEGIAYKYEWSQKEGRKVKGKMLVENVNMMAERKASNRTKRAATDTGLTSVEEMVGVDSGTIDVDFETKKEAPKKGKARGKKEARAKEEAAKKKEEEGVGKEEATQKPPEVKKEERPVQGTDVVFEKEKYNPKGPPTEYQWKVLDKIHEAIGDDNYRHVLDIEGLTLETELTLDKADKIIKENPIKKKEEDELPLDDS